MNVKERFAQLRKLEKKYQDKAVKSIREARKRRQA